MTVFPVLYSTDSATIEQLVYENMTPDNKISYEPSIFEGQQLIILTIYESANQPYAYLCRLWNNVCSAKKMTLIKPVLI
jgi:hypothetical protein